MTVRVELPWTCFGFEVTGGGWVIEAAPIAAWTGLVGAAEQLSPPTASGPAEELRAAVNKLDADPARVVHQKVPVSR